MLNFFFFSFRVGLDFPTIEVRYEHLNIEALAHVGNRGLPTFLNTITNYLEVVLPATFSETLLIFN